MYQVYLIHFKASASIIQTINLKTRYPMSSANKYLVDFLGLNSSEDLLPLFLHSRKNTAKEITESMALVVAAKHLFLKRVLLSQEGRYLLLTRCLRVLEHLDLAFKV